SCEPEDGGAPCGGGVVVGGVVCHPPPWPDAAFAPDPPEPGVPPTWPLVSSDTLVGAGWTAFSRPDLTASPPGEPPVPPPCAPSLPSPPPPVGLAATSPGKPPPASGPCGAAPAPAAAPPVPAVAAAAAALRAAFSACALAIWAPEPPARWMDSPSVPSAAQCTNLK